MDLNLNLNVNEVNAILAGLGELPAKNTYDLISKVKMQAELQMAANSAQPQPPELLVEKSDGSQS